MKELDQLHAIHQEATDLFEHTDNKEARNELSQTLCVLRTMIFVIEGGGELQSVELSEAIDHAHQKIQAALAISEPQPDNQ
jgi:hypothetical protein